MRVHASMGVAVLFALGIGVSSARAGDISAAQRNDILTLLHLCRADTVALLMANYSANAMLDVIIKETPSIPDEAIGVTKDEVRRFLADGMPGLMERLVPIYARHFTPEEVKDLIAFYRTPLGSKTVRETPLIGRESMLVGEEWARSQQPELIRRLKDRYRLEGLTSP